MRGRGESQLSVHQQAKIRPLINKNPYCDSFFLVSQEAVATKAREWQAKLPWIRPFYAMKSNPMPEIIREVVNNRCGLDCASKDEILTALSFGLGADDIVYSNVVKAEADLLAAARLGITLTTADTF